jgi:hypothetical protein
MGEMKKLLSESFIPGIEPSVDPEKEKQQVEEFLSAVGPLENEFAWLGHKYLLERAGDAGIDVPREKWKEPIKGERFPTLNLTGANWLRRQLRDYDRETVKFWSSIVIPLGSLLVAILSLLVVLHRRN